MLKVCIYYKGLIISSIHSLILSPEPPFFFSSYARVQSFFSSGEHRKSFGTMFYFVFLNLFGGWCSRSKQSVPVNICKTFFFLHLALYLVFERSPLFWPVLWTFQQAARGTLQHCDIFMIFDLFQRVFNNKTITAVVSSLFRGIGQQPAFRGGRVSLKTQLKRAAMNKNIYNWTKNRWFSWYFIFSDTMLWVNVSVTCGDMTRFTSFTPHISVI